MYSQYSISFMVALAIVGGLLLYFTPFIIFTLKHQLHKIIGGHENRIVAFFDNLYFNVTISLFQLFFILFVLINIVYNPITDLLLPHEDTKGELVYVDGTYKVNDVEVLHLVKSETLQEHIGQTVDYYGRTKILILPDNKTKQSENVN